MKIFSIGNCELVDHLGSGKTRLRWLEGLRREGAEVDSIDPTAFALRLPGLPKALKLGWGALFAAKRRMRSGSFDLSEFFGSEMTLAMKWVRSNRPNTLVVHHVDGLELQAFFGGRLPHEVAGASARSKLRHHWALKSVILPHRIVLGCSDDREYLLRKGLRESADLIVISPGVDESFLDAAPLARSSERERSVTFMGSWTPRKNLPVVKKVAMELTNGYGVHFHVIGASSDRLQVESELQECNQKCLEVHQRMNVPDLVKTLLRSKVLFLPSLNEGFGMATTEAMACGMVPVLTPTGYGVDLAKHKIGFIGKPDDSEAFVQEILRLLNDDVFFDRQQDRALRHVEAMTWKNQQQQLSFYYRDLVGSSKS